MAVTALAQLTQSQQQLLQAEFILAVQKNYVYAQPPLAWTPAQGVSGPGNRFSSLAMNFYSPLQPSVSAVSETADIVPVTLEDQQFTVAPDFYGNAVQESLKVRLQSTPDVAMVAAQEVGRNAAESVDYLARTQAVAGQSVIFGGDATNRATISEASSADQIDTGDFLSAATYLSHAPDIPGMGVGVGTGVAAIVRKAVMADLVEDGVIILIGEQVKPEIILNGEIGQHITGVRLIESNFAKIFQGGAASVVASSGALQNALPAGSTALVLGTSMSSGANGQYWTLGTVESSGNGEQLAVETVFVGAGGDTSNVTTITGGGPNGGTWYAYSSGAAVTHNYQAYATVFMGAQALAKVYTTEQGLGPNPNLLTPEDTGLLKQFRSWAWSWYGGFGRVAENRLFRVEHSAARFTLGV